MTLLQTPVFSAMFWEYRGATHVVFTWIPSCSWRIRALTNPVKNEAVFWSVLIQRNINESVDCSAGHSSTVTILKIWFGPPCLGNATTGVPGSLLPSDTSSTWSISLLIVPSSSKCHSWLGPPWGSNMITLPVSWLTSSTSLHRKIPNFETFLVFGNVYQLINNQ